MGVSWYGWNWLITPEPSVLESRIRHQMTRTDELVRMMYNMTCLHDVCMIACLHANIWQLRSLNWTREISSWPRTLNLGTILFLLTRPTRSFFPRLSRPIRSETARRVVPTEDISSAWPLSDICKHHENAHVFSHFFMPLFLLSDGHTIGHVQCDFSELKCYKLKMSSDNLSFFGGCDSSKGLFTKTSIVAEVVVSDSWFFF